MKASGVPIAGTVAKLQKFRRFHVVALRHVTTQANSCLRGSKRHSISAGSLKRSNNQEVAASPPPSDPRLVGQGCFRSWVPQPEFGQAGFINSYPICCTNRRLVETRPNPGFTTLSHACHITRRRWYSDDAAMMKTKGSSALRGRRVRFTPQVIDEVKSLLAEGISRDEIANRLGVTVGVPPSDMLKTRHQFATTIRLLAQHGRCQERDYSGR
jgi:hypothetical protein